MKPGFTDLREDLEQSQQTNIQSLRLRSAKMHKVNSFTNKSYTASMQTWSIPIQTRYQENHNIIKLAYLQRNLLLGLHKDIGLIRLGLTTARKTIKITYHKAYLPVSLPSLKKTKSITFNRNPAQQTWCAPHLSRGWQSQHSQHCQPWQIIKLMIHEVKWSFNIETSSTLLQTTVL